MYADRVETASRSSIKDRLNGGALENPGRRSQVTGKRFVFFTISNSRSSCKDIRVFVDILDTGHVFLLDFFFWLIVNLKNWYSGTA